MGRVKSDMVQKMLGLCEAENGTKIDELLQAGASGHKRAWNMLIRIQALEDGRIPAKEATNGKLKENVKGLHRNWVHTFPLDYRFIFSFLPDLFSFVVYVFFDFFIVIIDTQFTILNVSPCIWKSFNMYKRLKIISTISIYVTILSWLSSISFVTLRPNFWKL